MKDLGFKAGIEIHQRLDTHKLFCPCKSQMSVEEPTKTIERTLRPVAGETGEIDRAALFEALRGRKFRYLCYPEETCLVEADEEPPHDVNEKALKTSVLIAKMFNCDIPDEIQFMRKTVIDGSNTSGFQRTAIVGLNGSLNTSLGKIGIINVCLEEEAAQIIEKKEKEVIYGLDRLGIPLVEIGTAPDLKTPKHVKEVAEKIGMLLRSTGKVQRGIGTIRQDVNISISGGARVEIKGLQDLRTMEKVIEGEIKRQQSLLSIRDILRSRNSSATGPIEVTSIFQNTKNKMVSSLLKNGKKAFAFKLIGFSGLLSKKICFEKTFGKELADYAKLYGVGGFIHSDEDLTRYDLEKEFSELKTSLKAKNEDIVGIVVEEPERAKKACLSIIERAKKAREYIPEETRYVNPDLTTSYLRPLPGGARMYPETDVKPIAVAKDLLNVKIPESFEEKVRRFKKLGLSEELANQMVKSRYLSLFEETLKTKSDPKTVASVLLLDIKELKRDGIEIDNINREELIKMLKNINTIPKESIKDLLRKLSYGKTFEDSMGSLKTIGILELDNIIDKLIDKNLVKREGSQSFKKLMGPVMAKVRGKIDGEVVAKRLMKKIKDILSE